MAYISKEIPAGAINGVNTIFTLLDAPSIVYNIFMDGVVYTTFSVTGNQLTLDDAPVASIFVDYQTGGGSIVVPSQTTLADVKNEVYINLGQTASSTTFSSPRVTQRINSVLTDIIRSRVVNRLTKKIYRGGRLRFMDGYTSFMVKAGSQTTIAVPAGTTRVYCDTSTILMSWYCNVGGEVLRYTGIGSDTNGTYIVTATALSFAHKANEVVSQLYPLPTTAERPNYAKQVIFSAGEQRELPLEYDKDQTYASYYNIYYLGNLQLIGVTGLETSSVVKVYFNYKVTPMVNDTDVCVLPDYYGITVLAAIVAGELGYPKAIPNAELVLNSGYDKLQEMYQFYVNDINVVKQSLKATPYQFRSMSNY